MKSGKPMVVGIGVFLQYFKEKNLFKSENFYMMAIANFLCDTFLCVSPLPLFLA